MSHGRRSTRNATSAMDKVTDSETGAATKRPLNTKNSTDTDPVPLSTKKTRFDKTGAATKDKLSDIGVKNVRNRRAASKSSPTKARPKAQSTEETNSTCTKNVSTGKVTDTPGEQEDPNKDGSNNRGSSESDVGEETFTVEIVPNLPDKGEGFENTQENSDKDSIDDTGDEEDDDDDDDANGILRGDYDVNELVDTALAAVSNSKDDGDEGQKRSYKREFNIPCAYCEVMLKDYGYLFRHVSRLHKSEPDVNEYLDEIRPRMRAPCPICKKTVSCVSNVSAHIKQCHADDQCAVTCPLCKKSYKTPMSLKQHIKQCHQPQVRKHKCSYCDMSFSESRGLKEHINCTHETTQIFRCDECGKTFLTKGRLRRHKYIHSEYRHYCQYCNKGFHLKDNMNKHIEIMHEKKQGKRFQCPHCEKNFAVKGNMKQHVMGVHLRQYPYSCPICGEGYRRKKDMLLHMEQHKEGMSSLKIEDVNIDPHSIKLPPPSVKVQMAPSDGATMGTTVIEVLPQKIKVHTE